MSSLVLAWDKVIVCPPSFVYTGVMAASERTDGKSATNFFPHRPTGISITLMKATPLSSASMSLTKAIT